MQIFSVSPAWYRESEVRRAAEGQHGVARVVFHGQRGERRQRYGEGQEDRLGALGLVVDAVVLWNTRYLE
jgi:TnpA family transposase